jgi:hypothetical protein
MEVCKCGRELEKGKEAQKNMKRGITHETQR